MSLISVCRTVAIRAGLASQMPPVWAGSSEAVALEVVDAVNQALVEMSRERDWQVLRRDWSAVLALAPAEQTVALPPDYDRFVPDTMWLADQWRPVGGPLTDAALQRLRQGVASPLAPSFAVSGNVLILRAAVGAGETLVGRYISSYRVSGNQTAYKVDSDEAVLDETVLAWLALGTWQSLRGFDATAALGFYQRGLSRIAAREEPFGVTGLSRRRWDHGDAPVTPGVAAVGVAVIA